MILVIFLVDFERHVRHYKKATHDEISTIFGLVLGKLV